MSSAKISFGALCAAKLEQKGIPVRQLVKSLKNTPASQFTRWKQGLWTYIEHDKLQAIAEAISDDPREQCDLIVAFLHDMTPMKYRPMILHMQKGESPFSITDGQAPWSEPQRRKMEAIAEAYELNEDFAQMVDHLHTWARRVKKEQELQAATAKRPSASK
jgi:hypothetical protein